MLFRAKRKAQAIICLKMRALVSLGLKQATAHAFVSIAEDRLHEKLAVPVLKNLPDFHLGSAWRFAHLCKYNKNLL